MSATCISVRNISRTTGETDLRSDVAGWREGVSERCQDCETPVVMLTAFEAAVLAGVSIHTIYRWAERGALHFAVARECGLLVCSDSLPQRRDEDLKLSEG